jgi:hypothetical protein
MGEFFVSRYAPCMTFNSAMTFLAASSSASVPLLQAQIGRDSVVFLRLSITIPQ